MRLDSYASALANQQNSISNMAIIDFFINKIQRLNPNKFEANIFYFKVLTELCKGPKKSGIYWNQLQIYKYLYMQSVSND